MKKIFCFDICSCHYLRQNLSTSDLSFSQVTSVEKREPRKHFSASAYGLGFKNFFLGTLFSTSVTWEKLKSDVDKFCLRRGKNKYRNKILILLDSQNHLEGYLDRYACLKSITDESIHSKQNEVRTQKIHKICLLTHLLCSLNCSKY